MQYLHMRQYIGDVSDTKPTLSLPATWIMILIPSHNHMTMMTCMNNWWKIKQPVKKNVTLQCPAKQVTKNFFTQKYIKDSIFTAWYKLVKNCAQILTIPIDAMALQWFYKTTSDKSSFYFLQLWKFMPPKLACELFFKLKLIRWIKIFFFKLFGIWIAPIL